MTAWWLLVAFIAGSFATAFTLALVRWLAEQSTYPNQPRNNP